MLHRENISDEPELKNSIVRMLSHMLSIHLDIETCNFTLMLDTLKTIANITEYCLEDASQSIALLS